ncbi:hypothetical protein RDI58_016756 [Solanum bulbocastanum]|uniref:DUF4218 domain-containing protein n=1 Tax=Solanum bulbocastanum TaxID=147425 RepID=A0AAN8YE21_SOLBU
MEQNVQENADHPSKKQPHLEMDKFERLMKEANEELYPGCKKFSKVSFLLHIYRTKCMFKWSNESFNSLLGLLKDALPEGYELPSSFYETKKIIEDLGLKYEKIHACPNDSSDGFNPFGTMRRVHSTWQVILLPYNLPPWMCMKQEFFILSLLIPEPKAPGNNIDVFLQPLIEELNELWDVGIEKYDTSTKEMFHMRATLMWPINDFRAYGTLSGWSTSGRFACPSCNINTHYRRITYEIRLAPCTISGSQVLNQVKDIKFTLGKSSEGVRGVRNHTWKKRSYLPYWEYNLDMKIRSRLWPQYRASRRTYLPPTYFTMSSKEKELFYEVLENAKFPHGYSSNIARWIRKRKLSGLKTHFCHVIIQELLPIALRRSTDKIISFVLIELCTFFRVLCSKVLKLDELKLLEERFPEILSTMEKLFPPGFFTIMVHLVTHLATEARLAGPVHYRWMYPIESEHIAEIKRSHRKRHLNQHQLDCLIHFQSGSRKK